MVDAPAFFGERGVGGNTGEPNSRSLCTMKTTKPNKSNFLNWQMFALWIFVAASFAALCFAGHVIWAKCHGK
jgi:hypothetical protein